MPSLYKSLTTARNVTAIIIIIFVATVITLRFVTFGLNQYRSDIENKLSDLIGYNVKVGDIYVSWKSVNPEIRMEEVRLIDIRSNREVMQFKKARVDIGLLDSIAGGKLIPTGLMIDGASLYVVRHPDRTIAIQGIGVSDTKVSESDNQAFAQWLLANPYIGIENCNISWKDEYRKREFSFSNVNLHLKNENGQHFLKGSIHFPEKIGRALEFDLAIKGDVLSSSEWEGSLKTRGTQLGLNVFLDEVGRDYLALSEGVVSFDLQGEFKQARIESIEGELELDNIKLVNQNEFIKNPADVDISRFKWQRENENWTLDIDKAVFQEGDIKEKGSHIRIAVNKNNAQVDIDSAMNRSISQIALMFGKLDKKMIDAIVTMRPEGKLEKFHTSFNIVNDAIEQIAFNTQLSDLTIQPWKSIPGFTALSGTLRHANNAGSLEIETDSDRVEVNIPHVFRKSWPIREMTGRIDWARKGKAWEITTSEIDLAGKDLEMQVKALVRIEENTSPYLDVKASFNNGNAEQVYSYLPVVIMPDRVVKWLDRSIISGHVKTGTAVFRGQVKDFPFEKNNGQFKVDFTIENVLLDYMQDWPRIDQIEAQVVFSGNSMNIDVEAGKIFDADILETKVSIPILSSNHPVLNIKGKVDSTTRDGIAFLKQSPLNKKFANLLPEKEVKGKCNINLNLGISLSDKASTAAGSIKFINNTLIGAHDLKINQINGLLSFSDKGVTQSRLSGVFLDKPITADIYSEKQQGKKESFTTMDIASHVEVEKLMKQYNWPWLIYFSGNADWRAKVQFPQDWGSGEGKGQLHIESDLSGLGVNLPSPLGKEAVMTRTLELEVDLATTDTRKISMLYGKDISGIFELEEKENRTSLSRGGIHLGSEGTSLPEKSLFKLSGDLASIDIDNWITFSKSQTLWKPDGSALTLFLDADHLHIERHKGDKETTESKEDTFDPRDIPTMFVKAKRFTYGNAELGQLDMEVAKVENGLSFKHITLNSSKVKAEGSGNWLYINDVHNSSLNLKIEHESFGELLSQLDYENEFEGSRSILKLDARWDGSPYDWSLRKVEGSMNIDLDEGRIRDIDPGKVGRIFGLLSLRAIPRRLSLDFSDLFKKGFTFDSIRGNFSIDQGNAYTNNLVVKSPAGLIVIAGRIGLTDEDYDQTLVYTPTLSGSFAVAGAVAGGPLGAAIAVITEKLFRKQISRVTKYEYTVTGTWEKPVITKIKEEDKKPEKIPDPIDKG